VTLSNPISIEDFENAVWEWFSASIEADAIWTNKSGPRPDYPYGTLKTIAGPTPASPFFEPRTDTDLTRAAGSEVRFIACVPCAMTVSCQVLVGRPDGNVPDLSALNLATRALARLGLPTVQAAFRTAGISVQNPGTVSDISAIVNDGDVKRAGFDVVFNAALNLEEYTGYIAKIDAESTELGIDQEFGDV